MDKVLLYSITMNNYLRKIKLADSRRVKYFEVGDAFPNKYRSGILNGNLQYRERTKKKPLCLFDTVTKEFVLKNPKVAGTERWEMINGQKIYNAGYHPIVRAKIMEQIHTFIKEQLSLYNKDLISHSISNLPEDKALLTEHGISYPLYIECEVHDLIKDPISKNQKWDVFNRTYPFCKAFEDVLQELGIIEDDSVEFVRCPSHPFFFPIGDGEIPKLVFNIYKLI